MRKGKRKNSTVTGQNQERVPGHLRKGTMPLNLINGTQEKPQPKRQGNSRT